MHINSCCEDFFFFLFLKMSVIWTALHKHQLSGQTAPNTAVTDLSSISIPERDSARLCSCEPLLYAATEHREVGVPLNVLHPRVNAGGHVPTSVQRLQPKRVVPVELPEGEKKEVKWFDRGLVAYTADDRCWQNNKLETYHLVPHLYNVFIAVIESKVAVEKRGTSHYR